MIITLQDGKQIDCWIDEEDDEVVFLCIYDNGVTLTIPKECFLEIANEVGEAAKSFISQSRRN